MSRFATVIPDWTTRYREYLFSLTGAEGRESAKHQVGTVSRFLRWCQDNGIDAEGASHSQVERWIRRPRPDGLASAETTQYTRRSQLSRFFYWLMEQPDSFCYDNPAAAVRVRSPQVSKRATPMRVLSAEETEAIVEAVEAWSSSPHQARHRVVIGLLVHHGLRPAEIRAARLSDYRRSVDGVPAMLQTSIRREAGKLPYDLHVDVASAIDRYLRMWRVGPQRGRGAWLLLSASGGQMYRQSVLRLVHELAERAGIERYWEVTPYSLRRAALNHALRSGMSTPEIAELAGHRSVRTTEQYLARLSGRPSPERMWAWRREQLGRGSGAGGEG